MILHFFEKETKMYYIYILTNHSNSVLYVGVTNNLIARLNQHKTQVRNGFAKKYKCYKLVYFENTECVKSAITREKQIKGWTRTKKEDLINSANSQWNDLSASWS